LAFKIKVNDVKSALEKVKKAVKGTGGSFSGDNIKGEFSGKGVSGRYSVLSGGEVQIIIDKKPFYAPESMVEGEIRKFFS